MKNIVRAFVLSLVVTGAFASSHIDGSKAVSGKVSAFPVPQCEPSAPGSCGMCQHSACFVN